MRWTRNSARASEHRCHRAGAARCGVCRTSANGPAPPGRESTRKTTSRVAATGSVAHANELAHAARGYGNIRPTTTAHTNLHDTTCRRAAEWRRRH